jgi:hypothetical protein
MNYEIWAVLEILISSLELKRWSLEFVISFPKVYVWNLELTFGLFILGSCNSNLKQTDEFSIFIFSTIKIKKILYETLTTYNQHLFSRIRHLCVIWIFILDTDKAQNYSCRFLLPPLNKIITKTNIDVKPLLINAKIITRFALDSLTLSAPLYSFPTFSQNYPD